VPHSNRRRWYVPAVALAALVILPLSVLLLSWQEVDVAIWAHLWQTQLPRLLGNTLQLVLGVGKYTNRGVFDGAAGVCRGTEQWTVRAGRRLSSAPASTDVGPIRYQVVEPLRAIRIAADQGMPIRQVASLKNQSIGAA